MSTFEFLTAKCSSSVPGSRDKNNPVYVAPAMNSPTKRPERTLKKKKLFKLTGDILGMERKWQHINNTAPFPEGKGRERIKWKVKKG